MSHEYPWSDAETIAKLSHRRFGKTLARRVAGKLKRQHISRGLFHSHRDYCGHGLIYRDGQFILVEVHDGWPEQSKFLAAWESEDEFVEFLANLSDFVCSGADADAKLFYTDDSHALNNQRITKQWLKAYADSK